MIALKLRYIVQRNRKAQEWGRQDRKSKKEEGKKNRRVSYGRRADIPQTETNMTSANMGC